MPGQNCDVRREVPPQRLDKCKIAEIVAAGLKQRCGGMKKRIFTTSRWRKQSYTHRLAPTGLSLVAYRKAAPPATRAAPLVFQRERCFSAVGAARRKEFAVNGELAAGDLEYRRPDRKPGGRVHRPYRFGRPAAARMGRGDFCRLRHRAILGRAVAHGRAWRADLFPE